MIELLGLPCKKAAPQQPNEKENTALLLGQWLNQNNQIGSQIFNIPWKHNVTCQELSWVALSSQAKGERKDIYIQQIFHTLNFSSQLTRNHKKIIFLFPFLYKRSRIPAQYQNNGADAENNSDRMYKDFILFISRRL